MKIYKIGEIPSIYKNESNFLENWPMFYYLCLLKILIIKRKKFTRKIGNFLFLELLFKQIIFEKGNFFLEFL